MLTHVLVLTLVFGELVIWRSADQQPPPLPKGAMPTLGRPTTKDDPVPVLNFEDYFVGNWKFEWDVPDSELGPGGHISGTETYKKGLDGKFYESEIDATGPQGPFKVKSSIIYLMNNKVLSRHEQDNRGFSYLMSGTIGADLGGYFNIYYESTPFTFNGKTIRLKKTTRLLSPVSYRMTVQISVDGEPFRNFGQPWWSKNVPGVTSPR